MADKKDGKGGKGGEVNYIAFFPLGASLITIGIATEIYAFIPAGVVFLILASLGLRKAGQSEEDASLDAEEGESASPTPDGVEPQS
jgi:hypothetical protein